MITRNNFEEFFLLYVDNELPAPERKAVEAFVRENPDLEQELTRLLQSTFKPDSAIVFENKDSLMKETADPSFINMGNYEEYFLLYTDKELDEATAKEVEFFASRHPALLGSLQLLLQTRPEPDMAVVFEGKEILYKKEADERITVFPWFSVAAAAAAVVLVLIGFFVFTGRMHTTTPLASSGGGKIIEKAKDNSKNIPAENKNQQRDVTSLHTAPLDITEEAKKKMTAKGTSGDKQSMRYIAGRQMQNKQEGVKNTRLGVQALPEINETAKTNTVAAIEVTKTSVETDNMISSSLTPTQDDLINKTGKPAIVKTADSLPNYVMQSLQENNTPDEFYLANTTAKKNKLRGLFRKVSRVFDRNANADDDNKHGVLIGGFQIALK